MLADQHVNKWMLPLLGTKNNSVVQPRVIGLLKSSKCCFCSIFIARIIASWLGQKIHHNYLFEALFLERTVVPSVGWASCFVCAWTVTFLRGETLQAQPVLWADNLWMGHPKRKRLEFIDIEKCLSRWGGRKVQETQCFLNSFYIFISYFLVKRVSGRRLLNWALPQILVAFEEAWG